MNEKIALELFGYLGTALVLISFVMHDIKWLRAVNMAGGLISLIYAIIVNTMPVVVLNGSLILINGIQLMRILRQEREAAKVISDGTDTYTEEDKDKEEDV